MGLFGYVRIKDADLKEIKTKVEAVLKAAQKVRDNYSRSIGGDPSDMQLRRGENIKNGTRKDVAIKLQAIAKEIR